MAKETKPTSDELQRFVPAGLKWLYEMEALNSPVLLNNLYGNIFAFPNVDDAEILIDRNNRKMLILIRFNWSTRNFFKSRKKETTLGILDQLQELLPSFSFRVTEDRALFDMAVQGLKRSLTGGKNDAQNDTKPADGQLAVVPAVGGSDATSEGVQTPAENPATEAQPEAVEADSQKPSED